MWLAGGGISPAACWQIYLPVYPAHEAVFVRSVHSLASKSITSGKELEVSLEVAYETLPSSAAQIGFLGDIPDQYVDRTRWRKSLFDCRLIFRSASSRFHALFDNNVMTIREYVQAVGRRSEVRAKGETIRSKRRMHPGLADSACTDRCFSFRPRFLHECNENARPLL